jgi:hypothetical protein
MNCHDFERIWNELFDAGSSLPGEEHASAAGENELALLEHATGCTTCRRRAAGFQVLHRAILAWGKAPAPPLGLADRVLAAARAPLPASRPAARKPQLVSSKRLLIAAAASILAVITVGVISRMTFDRARDRGRLATETPGPAPSVGHGTTESPKLNDVLASATAATWDLARSASEPAARLSRQFLDATTDSTAEHASGESVTVSVPSLESFAPDSAAAVATIQQVGDRLASGVRPLSSTARQAFGFLLGPAPPKPDVRTNPPPARGA